MRLALADVKKIIHRRDGIVYVAPYLLRPRERPRELASLIALFEGALGRPRSAFPADLPAEIIGDYRLARCLVLCLNEWYTWQSPAWATAAQGEEVAALAAAGVAGPTHLRLALYEYASQYGGYLPTAERERSLSAFASSLGVSRPTLDTLLTLDADENAVLERQTERAPEPRELAVRYNQRAFEALLSSAATVELTLPPTAGTEQEGERGALVKRLCFLAKRLGVQYEIGFEGVSPDERDPTDATDERDPTDATTPRVADAPAPYSAYAPRPLDTAADRPLVVTLFGPREVVGSPIQYGERLAAICRALLGYRHAGPSAGDAPTNAHGLAHVYLHGRPLLFALDERTLRLVRGEAMDASVVPAFDSSLESRLHAEFAAYEQAGEAHGWRLEREPEPIIIGDTLMIPDFALTRGARRVYLEIAGYWRPEYRERKLRKLNALRGAVSLIVAAPTTTRAEYAALADDFPLLWYGSYLGARPLLDLLDRAFDDRERRLAMVDGAALLETLARRQVIPEEEATALLRVYSRNERADALARLRGIARTRGVPEPEWLDGVGLAHAPWVAETVAWLRERVRVAGEAGIPLAALSDGLRQHEPALARITPTGAESLARRSGLALARPSLFEVIVTSAGSPAPEVVPPPQSVPASQPRRGVRRTHHREVYSTQSLFDHEPADPNNSTRDAPTPESS